MRRCLTVAVLALGLLTPAAAAQAQGPIRTGWWNTGTVSGTALPSTTAPDQLHLAQGPTGQLAFAAVSYSGSTYASAELVLHVASGSELGTPAALVCPTRDDRWKAGGDQPLTAAPTYDCAGRSASAVVGADKDGATLTFLLDPSLQLSPGTTSLAIVPAPGTAPFSLDLLPPDASSLTVVPATPRAQPSATSGAVAPSPSSTAPAFAGGSGFAPVPTSAPLVSVPLAAAPTPSVADAAKTPAPQVPAATPLATRSRLSTRAGSKQAAVLLVLVLGALAYTVSQQRTQPLRLLGGRARASQPPVEAVGQPRGIGRFAKPRPAPARRLL